MRVLFDGLDDLEALKLGVPLIKRLVAAGAAMRLTEGFRRCPGLERRLVTPNSMRGIQHMILSRWSTQQMERYESRNAGKMRIAGGPDFLEGRLGTGQNLEAIHGYEHAELLVIGRI